MGRRGVAATLVSFLVFTAMLLANSALYSAQSSSLRAEITTAEQVRETALGGILTGLSTYNALAAAQDYLESTPLDCSSAPQYLDSAAGTLQNAGSEDGIGFGTNTSWSYAQSPMEGSGSAYVPEFSGYLPGALNLEVVLRLDETYNGGLPSYSTVIDVAAHLPIFILSLASGCLAALSDLQSELLGLSVCNSTGVDAALGLAAFRYPLLDSYTFGATATLSPSGCEVYYWVATSVGGLEGVAGAYQLTVRGEGNLQT